MSVIKLNAANLAYSTLNGGINDSTETLYLNNATNFPLENFIISVDSEIILIASRDGNTLTVKEGCRGYEDTTPAAHDDGATVSNSITAGYLNNVYDFADGKLDAGGGAMTGDIDFNGNLLINPVIQSYREDFHETLNASSNVVLDLNVSNVFYVEANGNILIDIENAPTDYASMITLHLVLKGSYSISWQAPAVVIASSANVAANASNNSFTVGSGDAFAENVQPGDLITVDGFSSDVLNSIFRVQTATTSTIYVTEDIPDEAAGNLVTVTRRKDMFQNGLIPDAPEPYIPKTFQLYSFDGDRWFIVEVGEF